MRTDLEYFEHLKPLNLEGTDSGVSIGILVGNNELELVNPLEV